jgi:hypothetical protein
LVVALPFCACDFEERVPAEMTSLTQSRPLGTEKGLDAEIRYDIGSLEIAAEKSSSVYSLDLEYDKSSYQPEVKYDAAAANGDGRLMLQLSSIRKIGIRNERHSNRLRLNLSSSIPLALRVNTGVGDARLSLTGLKVSRLELQSGVGGSKVSAYEPNSVTCEYVRIKNGVGSMDAIGLGNLNFRELEFEGGVGGANLDLTGSWKQDADISVQVGVGGVNLKMPRDLGVKVEAEKHFLSGLHLEGFNKRDSYYFSENYDKAKIRVSVRVATGVGGFRITWL